MSAKAGAAGSIALGLLAIVAAPYSGGASLALYASIIGGAAMVGVGIYSLAFAPKNSNRDAARASELQYSTAADGVPLPIVFGEQRVVGNFMNYTADNFRSVKVEGRSDGSKGGDSQPTSVIGFDYYLTYEYGLCMGSIDEILQVFAAPGEKKMMGDSPTVVVYPAVVSTNSDTYTEINLDSVDPSSSGGAEGGLVRIYRGTTGQQRLVASDPYNFDTTLTSGRIKTGYRYTIAARSVVDFTSYGSADNVVGTSFIATNNSGSILTINDSVIEYTGLNYRNICWALFMDFRIGRFPQPKSYHFVVRRFPAHDSSYDMLRPDGTTITGFKVRGSGDNTKPAYGQANPAAIIYECLTNPIWGRGLPDDIFDEASWISVSAYFAARHIGMSFTIDTPEKISSVIDGIRSQLKLLMTWDGEFLKLRCLLDLTTTHGKIQTLTKADVTSIKTSRPLWHATINEMRFEFQNKNKNYRPDAVHVKDFGNHRTTDRINSEKLQLNGLSDFNTARRQAFRILREKSYPVASFEFEMNRFHSQLEVGDVFKLWWDEYDQDSTMYCIVTKIEDSTSDEDGMKVYCTEDIVLTPTTGSEATPTPPSVSGWEQIQDVDQTEVGLWTGEVEVSPTGNFPVVVIEVPPILSNRLHGTTGRGWIAVIAQQPAAYHSSVKVYVKRPTQGSYSQLAHEPRTFAIAGTLSADFTNLNYTDRGETGFTFSLFDSVKDEAALLSMFSLVDTFDQDLEDILNVSGPFVVIENEILQIGKVDKLGSNSYRARNIVRGRFGSYITKRASGSRVMFMQTLTDKMIPLFDDAGNNMGGNGFTHTVMFKASATANPLANSIQLNNDDPFYIFHDTVVGDTTEENETFQRASDRPLAAELYDITDLGSTWTVRLRPRRRQGGGGTTGAFYSGGEMGYVTPGLGTLTYRVYVIDTTLNAVFRLVDQDDLTITVTPGSLSDEEKGLVSIAGIPQLFTRVDSGSALFYPTNKIMIETWETGGTFAGLLSLRDVTIFEV